MRACVLFNPRAGSAGQIEALRAALDADPDVTLRELGPADDLAALAGRAARDGFDVVAVAGGDGTVHAAANGLLAGGGRAALAVLPLGTGNDFCRTMAIPLDPVAALELIRTGRPRAIDAVRVEGGRTGYMVNAATGGFSGRVAAEVTAELKAAWGPLAYLRGAAGPLTDPPRYRVEVRFDGGPAERFDVLNVVVANARTAAGGIPVAPTANPEDGRLDVVLVRAGDTLDLSVVAARLMHGDYLGDENVIHRLARRVEIVADPPLPFSIDGERCEGARFAFTVVPRALRVLAGPDYHPAAGGEAALEDEYGADDEPVAAATKSVGKRLFGLLGGALLLAKRSPPGVAAGFAAVAVAVLLFAWLAGGAVGGEWHDWNARVMLAQRARATPDLDRFALALSWLGSWRGTTVVVVGLLTFFLARKHYLTAATLLGVVGGVALLIAVLKPAFGVARPEFFPHLAPADGLSFPSGHALNGTGLFGFLAALMVARGYHQRHPAWWAGAAACVLLAAGICWSRVYIGVHTPTDVAAGAVAATAWVAACLVARHYAMARPKTGALL